MVFLQTFLVTDRVEYMYNNGWMMIVDYSNADEEFGTVVDDLDKLGEEIGVRIRCQREEIFTKMHRV